MGGDHGPPVTVSAVAKVIQSHPHVKFLLFGQSQELHFWLKQLRLSEHPRISVIASHDDVAMDDKPAVALKNKRQSSMRLALESVRDGRANACVSAGNTGALMALGRMILRMLPGIDRPAIISSIPTLQKKPVYMLDLGANVDCDAKRLQQFAIMGNELCRLLENLDRPRVALLNVGEEDIKGSEELRSAHALLQQQPAIFYQGFIEADQIFSGEVDVVVTDGFTGNNVLKASEGLSRYLAEKIRAAFMRNLWTRLCGLLARPVIRAFKAEINPEKYNGASLIGLRGVVIKSHGSANIEAMRFAILEAIEQSNLTVPELIGRRLAQLDDERI